MRAVVSWLTQPRPPSLVLFFMAQPADKIRAFGPDSPEADLAMAKVGLEADRDSNPNVLPLLIQLYITNT